MNVRDLVPWRREGDERGLTARGGSSPMLTLHREMNRLFDDVFRSFDAPSLQAAASWSSAWPILELEETDKEYRVSAELPGLDQGDVEITVEDGVLTLRGEKRIENEDRTRAFSERFYGRFERRISLDRDIDEAKANASFRNGVLTVILPKSAKAAERAKRIPISGAEIRH